MALGKEGPAAHPPQDWRTRRSQAGMIASISWTPCTLQDTEAHLFLQLLLGLSLALTHAAGGLPIDLLAPLLLGVLRGEGLPQQAGHAIAPLVAALRLRVASWGCFLQGNLTLSRAFLDCDMHATLRTTPSADAWGKLQMETAIFQYWGRLIWKPMLQLLGL